MKKLIYIFIPILAILLMSHNTFATDVVPSGANASGWNGNPKVSCYAYFSDSTAIWTGWSNFCSVGSGSAKVGVRAISFRDKNDSSIWAYTGDYLQIQLTLTAIESQYQPQIYYLPDDNANLQMISMKVDGSFTASEGKELVLTYYAKYLGSNNPSELMMGSTTGREFLSWNTNSYILGGMSISAWHVEADNNDDVVAAIEQQTQQEQNAANEIENQSTDDIDTGDDSSATNLIGNINTLFTQIGNIQASDSCSVPADFGNLDLGNINFCTGKDKLPFVVTFGAYAFELIFVVGTAIILVKQVLSLFDWARA